MMDRFFRETAGQMALDQQNYAAELAAVAADHPHSLGRLYDDPTNSGAAPKLRRSRELIDKYSALYEARIAAARTKIETLDLAPKLKAELRAGFEKGVPTGREQAAEYWRLERAIVDEVEGMARDLRSSRAPWRSSGTQLLFDSQEDLRTYNGHVAALQSLEKQEDALQRAALTRDERALQGLRELAE